MVEKVKQKKVKWTGENPYIWIYSGDKVTTAVSYWRADYSEYGPGKAAFVLSDIKGDGFSAQDDHCVCLADNVEFARWAKDEIVDGYPGFSDYPEIYKTMPIVEAEFSSYGDTRKEWTETFKSDQLEIVAKWRNLGEPFFIELPASKWPYDLWALLIAASEAEVTINGVRAAGQVKPEDFAGHPATTGVLAFSETWVHA